MTIEELLAALPNDDFQRVDDQTITHQGYSFFSLPQGRHLLVVGQAQPSAPLLLSPESDYTRQADSLGVSRESKIGRGEFDDRYVIRDETRAADRLLTDSVINLVTGLEPFVELEVRRTGVDPARLPTLKTSSRSSRGSRRQPEKIRQPDRSNQSLNTFTGRSRVVYNGS